MRSVNVHLVHTTKDEVAAELAKLAEKGMGDHWYHPNRAHTRLTIHFTPGAHAPQPPNSADEFVGTLGAPPSVTLYVDSGSRLNPDEAGKKFDTGEIHALVERLLGRFQGVARDDLTKHLWTLDEIQGKKQVAGACFGDHETWRKRHLKPGEG